MAEVDVAIRLRGSADAKHRDIRRTESLFIKRSGPQPPLGNVPLDEAVQAGLEKRRFRLADRFHLIQVAVDPEYAVPNLGKARGAYTADVSKANHDYVLFALHAVRPGFIWG
jgi:hypothetical protein